MSYRNNKVGVVQDEEFVQQVDSIDIIRVAGGSNRTNLIDH